MVTELLQYYVVSFLKMKQEFSCFPEENMTEEAKREYIFNCETKKMKLDYCIIKEHKGLK